MKLVNHLAEQPHPRARPRPSARQQALVALMAFATLLGVGGCAGSSSAPTGSSGAAATTTATDGAIRSAGTSTPGGSDATTSAPAKPSTGPPGATAAVPLRPAPATTAPPRAAAPTAEPPVIDPQAKILAGCVSSATVVSSSVKRWNTAVRAKRSADLRSAAAELKKSATKVRAYANGAKDAAFIRVAGKVASELEAIATRYTSGHSVSGGALNANQRAMIAYCEKALS